MNAELQPKRRISGEPQTVVKKSRNEAKQPARSASPFVFLLSATDP